VKSLGAEIRIESEEGVGTAFVLSLPKKLPALTELRTGSEAGS
jgi:chemotaxis protein histidine kinase CheA